MLPIDDLKTKTWKHQSGNRVVETGYSWLRVDMVNDSYDRATKNQLIKAMKRQHKRELWEKCYGDLHMGLMELRSELIQSTSALFNLSPIDQKILKLLDMVEPPK